MGQELLAAGLAHGRITLKNAAEAINALHEEAMKHCKAGLHKARECGKLLADAKSHIKHGAFQAWVNEACDFSYETANRYIRLHEHWDELVEAVGSRMPGMTITEGIKKISQLTKEKQDQWAKSKPVAETGHLGNTTNGGAEQDGTCIRGGAHVWEEDPELEGEFCRNCHEPKPTDAQAADDDADFDPPDQEPARAEAEPAASLATKRLASLHHRIAELLGVTIGLVDEYHAENPNEEAKNKTQDALRVAFADFNDWHKARPCVAR